MEVLRCRECFAACNGEYYGDYCDDKCRTIGALRHEIAGLRVIDRNLDRVEQQLAEARAAGADMIGVAQEAFHEGYQEAVEEDCSRSYEYVDTLWLASETYKELVNTPPAAPGGGEL